MVYGAELFSEFGLFHGLIKVLLECSACLSFTSSSVFKLNLEFLSVLVSGHIFFTEVLMFFN